MHKKFKVLVNRLNAPKAVCNHLLGEDHSSHHQMVVGACIMTFGVVFVKVTATIPSVVIHVAGDITGYFIHAVGAIPFLKQIEGGEKNSEDNNNSENKNSEDNDDGKFKNMK